MQKGKKKRLKLNDIEQKMNKITIKLNELERIYPKQGKQTNQKKMRKHIMKILKTIRYR